MGRMGSLGRTRGHESVGYLGLDPGPDWRSQVARCGSGLLIPAPMPWAARQADQVAVHLWCACKAEVLAIYAHNHLRSATGLKNFAQVERT